MNKIGFLVLGVCFWALGMLSGNYLWNTEKVDLTDRHETLFTSLSFVDHPQRDHSTDVLERKIDDKRLYSQTQVDGVYFEQSTFKNTVDGLDIPYYLFSEQPVENMHDKPALVWVYGGIHDRFGVNYYPFIKEAIAMGFVVIAPEYRGARGYGESYYNEIDYGGLEVSDILSAAHYLSKLPAINKNKIGVIGWSHGGYIAALAVMRKDTPFARAVATVPVSNLIFRLSLKGPKYQQIFTTQPNIKSLPFENLELYKQRSPYYQVEHLDIPLMAQFATNDEDVNWEEAKMLAHALELEKPDLTEVIVYSKPEHGHYLNRQVNLQSLTRVDDPIQIDSWSHIWRFLTPLTESN